MNQQQSSEQPPVPPLVTAHNLLALMIAAARRTGDAGREFVTTGVLRLTRQEIAIRREASAEAVEISQEVEEAERLFDDSFADGVIDSAEAAMIRAKLRRPERRATALAQQLAIPEGVS